MVQQETMLDIADNSGVKSALCIKVLGRSGSRGKMTRPVASVGDVEVIERQSPVGDARLDGLGKCSAVGNQWGSSYA